MTLRVGFSRVALAGLLVVSASALGLPAGLAVTGDSAVDLDATGNAAVSVVWSQVAYPQDAIDAGAGPMTALIGRDDLFADNLASGVLQRDVPLLLTNGDQLDDAVAQELGRLRVESVTILGGTLAVSEAVQAQLEGLVGEVRRLHGETRIETAIAVAEQVTSDTAILVRGFAGDDPTQAFADSLAAGAWAAQTGWPVLFTETEQLTASTAAHLDAAGYDTVYLVGGIAALSEAVAAQVAAGAGEVVRVAGATRFATAVAIAEARGFADAADAAAVILVDGQREDAWADGFAAANLAGRGPYPIVLANSAAASLPPETVDFLEGQAATLAQASAGVGLWCGATAPDAQCEQAADQLGLEVGPYTSEPSVEPPGEPEPTEPEPTEPEPTEPEPTEPEPTEPEPTGPPSGGQAGGGSQAPDEEAQARDALQEHGDVVHAEGSAFEVTDVIVDPDDRSHVRFERTYHGLPMLGGDLVVHLDADNTFSGVSQTLTDDLDVDTNPSITADQAAAAAGVSSPVESQLVVDAVVGVPYLAWAISEAGIQADGTPSYLTTYVDAHTGGVVRREESINTVAGDGVGYHSGRVPLETTQVGASYELRDPTRGNSVTVDAANQSCFPCAGLAVFSDADNHWGDGTLADRQTLAVDVHYATAETWDYFRDVHGRNGISGDGSAAESRVHFGTNYTNAFFDFVFCRCMNYGDGNGVTTAPLTTLDIVGHEIAHGVTQATANLSYWGEAGGLHEATSEIFGALVEFHANNPVDPPDYTTGEKVRVARPLAWMDDPARDGASVSCWSSDVGRLDVHHSSGVGRHFFYLLAVGSGPSQWGDSPTCDGSTVVGIGNDAAGAIWYRALTVYMTSGTKYAGAADATLQAARDLYGVDSAEVAAVDAAWQAVNVAPNGLSVADVAVTEGHAGTATATFSVSLSSPQSAAFTVEYATADGSAVAPADYTTAAGTLTFAAGETSKTVAVAVSGDEEEEDDETFTVNLSNSSLAAVPIVDGQAVGTILDDDSWALSVDDVTVTEGSFGFAGARFTVSLSRPSPQPVTVAYATADGTAQAVHDYGTTSGSLSFEPGDTTRTVLVTVATDTDAELDETFTLNLSAPVGARLGDAAGLGTIRDDDPPSISVSDVTVQEGAGSASFTVSLSDDPPAPVTVDYATADWEAKTPHDYTAAAGTVTFAAGQTSRSVTVAINDDGVDEPQELFFLRVSNAAGAVIGDREGVGFIVDDDAGPVVSVTDASVSEGDAGTVAADFTVSLSAASEQQVRVTVRTADGTAVAPGDYAPAASTLEFAPGETNLAVAVAVNGDTLDEDDETFALLLSDPANATIGDGQGSGTIVNDDAGAGPGNLVAWGANRDGQVGDGSPARWETPAAVNGFTDVVAVEASQSFHSLAVRSDGTVWAWGYNGDGQLGDGTYTDRTTPVQVLGITDGVAACGGWDHSIVLRADGTVWGMGDGWSGSLGAPILTAEPVRVPGYSDIVALDCGGWHNVALRADGTLWTSGLNGAGEIGDGTTEKRSMPVQVLDQVVAISAGAEHTMAVTEYGTVWAWGWNASGQVGTGATSNAEPTPRQVSGLGDIVAVGGGWDHSLALRADGTVFAWGDNITGQLGIGTNDSRTTPVQVMGLDSVVSISAGGFHNLAVRADGTVWGWGGNWHAQLGVEPVGFNDQRTLPEQVPGVSGVSAVSAGQEHSLAVSS